MIKLSSLVALASVGSYCFNLFIANKFSASDFGFYSLLLTYATVISQLILFGSNENFLTLYHKGKCSFSSLIIFRFVNFLILIILLLFLGNKNYLFSLLFSLTSLGLIVFFEISENIKTYYKVFLFQRVLYFTIGSYLISNEYISLTGMAILLFLIDSCSLLYQTKINITKDRSSKLIKQLFTLYRYGLKSLAVVLLKMNFLVILRIYLSGISLAHLGSYMLAYQLLTAQSIVNVLVSKLYRNKLTKSFKAKDFQLYEKLKKTFLVRVMLVSLVTSFSMLFFGETFLRLLVDVEKYPNFSDYIVLVALYIPVVGYDGYTNLKIFIESIENYSTFVYGACSLANLILLLINNLNGNIIDAKVFLICILLSHLFALVLINEKQRIINLFSFIRST